MKTSRALLLAAIAVGLTLSTTWAGGSGMRRAAYPEPNAGLVIKRAANFGNQSSFNLYIDGVRVTTLSYGGTYRGVVPAGRHLITIKQVPHLNDAYPYHQQYIDLAAGRTSAYTAVWRDGGTRIALEKS